MLAGVEGARWPALHRLIDAGRLPTFRRLVETGSSGTLHADGLAGPMLWATIASGVPPVRHGIFGALEVRPDGGGVQPVCAGSWRTSPLWRILADHGIHAAAIGLPGVAPASAWSGCCVVDEYFAAPPPSGHLDWPLAPGCIMPPRLRPALRDLRVHPDELDTALRGGIPAGPLAAAVSINAAALYVAGCEPWQCLVTYGALLAADPSDAAYAFQDAMLAQMLAAAGPGADVIVVSADGVLIAAGPGFAQDAMLHGAGPADIAATVLARFGLRLEGAAGRVLDGTRHGALRPITARPMPAPLAGPPGPPPSCDAARLIASVQHGALLQRAASALASGDHAAAVPLLRAACAGDPADAGTMAMLGQCAFFLGDYDECLRLGRDLAARAPTLPWGEMLVGAALAMRGDAAADAHLLTAAALSGSDPQAHVRLGAIALHRGQPGPAQAHYRAALAHDPDFVPARAGLGLACIALGDLPGAERHLRAAIGARFHAPALHHQLGLLHAAQERWAEAASALRTALGQHPGLPGAAAALRRAEDAAVQDATRFRF